MNYSRISILLASALMGVALMVPEMVSLQAATTYQATWASVDKHPPAPEWFKDAKFGIYFHWGVFSVPAFGSEWYPNNMYNTSTPEYTHHVATYGTPAAWPFNNFIDGANDKNGNRVQFAPKLKTAGGNFDPDEWAQLFDSAGAKFAGPVAEHHDGFSMWNSQVNEWNSVGKGPKLDLASLFEKAIRAKGMKYIMTMHHAFHYNGFYYYAPTPSDPSLQKLFGKMSRAKEDTLWYNKLKEIIDLYKPDLIWHDMNLPDVPESMRLKFLAYYYNAAVDWGKEVVVTWKVREGGFNTNGEVGDYERGGPANIVTPYWLTDDAISSSSWCYTVGIGYYSTIEMLHAFIDRVSKNGNMLLNISPMADGSIPQAQRTVLYNIGDWLRKFGESIYSTRAWTVFGEGPTQMGGGDFSTPRAGTNRDFRYTRTKDTATLYAIALGWPGNGTQITMSSITSARFTANGVYLFGATPGSFTKINTFTQNAQGLTFSMPSTQPYTALAYAFKITSARSVAVNHSVATIDQQRKSVSGNVFLGGFENKNCLTLPDHAAGMEIYSLQGKKLFEYRLDGNSARGSINLKSIRGKLPPGAFLVKYMQK
ncbi:MAG: alpha-L-fucosidase [Chitinispirillaceae bacterium]|nr:alpha-L-fucosidase [Chitinispirillaceae bacterium]